MKTFAAGFKMRQEPRTEDKPLPYAPTPSGSSRKVIFSISTLAYNYCLDLPLRQYYEND